MLVKLSELCNIKSSKRIFENEYVEHGIPFIRGQEVSDGTIFNGNRYSCYISEKRYDELKKLYGVPQKGDILITAVGTIGNLCYIDNDFRFYYKDGNLLQFTNFREDIDSQYLYYFMHSEYFKKQLNNNLIGAVQKALTMIMLNKIYVPLSDRCTQKQIIKILSSIDNQIERNNSIVKKLQVLSQSIYNKWFVQFDYPGFDGEMQYNDILKKNIPFGWTACKLTECIKWESSSQPPKSTFSDTPQKGYIRFIQNRDYDSQNHITYIPLKSTTKTCTKYDIMMDKYGDAGRIRCGLEGAYNVALAKITPTIDFAQEYIRQILQKETNYEYLHNACMASTRASLNEQTLSGIIIPIPPKEILSEFEVLMKKIISYRFAVVDSINELISIKEKLLPLLINGQLE